jgi:hypothetical protein
MPLSLLEVGAVENTNGLELKLAWTSASSGNSTDYVWDSKETDYNWDKNKKIYLDVSYKNNGTLSKKYNAGDLKIKLKGIGNANRDYTMQAYDVAADYIDATNKTHKWSYSWDKATDMYTFINNEDIDVGVAGSFELIWEYSPFKTKNNYKEVLSASFYDKDDNLLLKSNEVTYSATRFKKIPYAFTSIGRSSSLLSSFNTSDIDLDDSKEYVGLDVDTHLCWDYNKEGEVPIQKDSISQTFKISADALVFDNNKNYLMCNEERDGNKYYTVNNMSGLYVFYPCDKIIDSSGKATGYTGRDVDISCTAKGKYYEDDYYTDFIDRTCSYPIRTRSYIEYVWGDRLWTSFSNKVQGRNHEDMHQNDTIGQNSFCSRDGWVSPKTMYSKNDYDLSVDTYNSWVNGFDGKDIAIGDYLSLRWYKSDEDGEYYVAFKFNGQTLNKRADSISDIVDIINNDVNSYTSCESADKYTENMRGTYTATLVEGSGTKGKLKVDYSFIHTPEYNNSAEVVLDRDDALGDSVKGIDGLGVTYDFIFATTNKYYNRLLKDNEYSWKSVTLPKKSDIVSFDNNIVDCKIKVLVRYANSKDYTLLKEMQLSDEEVVYDLPEGVCSVKLVILKGDGKVDYTMYKLFKASLKVDLHLDKSLNTKDEYIIEDATNTDSIISITPYYSYYVNGVENDLRDSKYFATNNYYDTADGGSSSSLLYVGNYGDKKYGVPINTFDKNTYGHEVTRSTPNYTGFEKREWAHIHTIKNVISYSLYYQDHKEESKTIDSYNLNVNLGFICNDKDTPLTKFSVSLLLQDTCFIDNKDLSSESILKNSKISLQNSGESVYNHVKVKLIKDYKGCIFIRYDFDFTGERDTFLDGNNLYISLPVKYDKLSVSNSSIFQFTKYRKWNTGSTNMGIIIDDNMLVEVKYAYHQTQGKVTDIYDFNDNGKTDEDLYYSSYALSESSGAKEHYRKATLSSKTSLNNYYTEENNSVLLGGDINYLLKLSPKSGESYYGVDFTWMFDNSSDWVGTLKSLGLCHVYNDRGYTPQLYYTYSDNPTEDDWLKCKYNYVNVKNAWILPEGNVKGLRYKVSVEDYKDVKLSDTASVYISMSAPTSEDLVGKYFKAKFTAKYLLSADKNDWETLESNEVSTKLEKGIGNLKVLKTDSSDNNPLSDAHFDIYNSDGSVYLTDVATDDSGEILVSNIPYGDYYVKETKVPKGYIYSDKKVNFTISSDDWLILNVKNDRIKGTVEITKKSAVSSYDDESGNYVEMITNWGSSQARLLKGAVFNLYDDSNNLLKSNLVTNDKGSLQISDLDWGTYHLKEVKAPDYYVITNTSKDVEFSINKDNVESPILLNVENGQKPAKVLVKAFEMSDDGSISNIPVQGVEFRLGYGVSTTNKNGVAFESNNFVFNNYSLDCTKVPVGYLIPDISNKNIVVSEENCDKPLVIKVGIERKKASVRFYKVDDKDILVPGAKYGLYKEDGTLVATTITNEKGFATFENIPWGIKYYIQEIEAPKGYSLNTEKYKFEVTANNSDRSLILSVKDDTLKGSVTLLKTDYSSGEPIQGAVYNVYKSDDTLLLKGLKTNNEGKLIAKDLEWGTYYFKEVIAPIDYCLSDEKVYFSVNYETVLNEQIVTAEDIKKVDNTIRVTKEIPLADINSAQGTPTFLYQIDGVTDDNKELLYNASIVFDKDSIDLYKEKNPDKATISLSTNVPIVDKGIYTVSEKSVLRYASSRVTDLKNGEQLSDNRVVFNIKGNINLGEVTFKSDKLVNSGLSSNDYSSNVISVSKGKDKPMNKLIAVYAEGTLSTETIDKSKLTVYMQYTDGSKKEVAVDNCTLSKETFDLSKYSDNTVYVSYTEGGKTYKTSFNITVAGESEFSYHELEDGTLAIDGYKGTDTTVYFPSQINGKKVSTIQSNPNENGYYSSVSGLDNVKEVIISDGIEVIGNSAFQGINSSVRYTLGKGIRRIEDNAFRYSKCDFDNIYLPNCEYVGANAFQYGNKLIQSLTLKGDSIIIGNSAFDCANVLGDITIEGKNVTISDKAFYVVSQYESLNYTYNDNPGDIVLKGISSIGSNAFYEASFKNLIIEGNGKDSILKSYSFNWLCYNMCRNNGDQYKRLAKYYENNDCFISIKNVGTIEKYAFESNYHFMGNVLIEGNDTKIGEVAFDDLGRNIQSYSDYNNILKLTGTFSEINRGAFRDSSFMTADLSGISSDTVLSDSLFWYDTRLKVVKNANGIIKYPNSMFEYCRNLENVEGFREDAVIEENAFKDTKFEQVLKDKGLLF